MQPVIVDFGEINLLGTSIGLRIYGYGLMLVLGFLVGIYLARWRAGRFGESPDAVTTLGLLALVGGVIGSRAAFVFEKWDSQFAWRDNPLPEILNITSGGLIYYGGAALALASMVVYLRRRKMPIRRYLDIVAPSLMVGLAFGRMGCLLNGCCYGGRCQGEYPLAMRFPYATKPLLKPGKGNNMFGASLPAPTFVHHVALGSERGGLGEADLPQWLFRRDPDGQVQRDEQGAPMIKMPADLTPEQARQAAGLRSLPVQPAQAFGAVNGFLIAGLLLGFSRLRYREGQVFALMLILYPVTRFVLELIRGDNAHNVFRLQLTHNQYTSAGMAVAGLLMWFILQRLPAAVGPSHQERLAAAEAQRPRLAAKRKGKRS